jgi:hypothetical protein
MAGAEYCAKRPTLLESTKIRRLSARRVQAGDYMPAGDENAFRLRVVDKPRAPARCSPILSEGTVASIGRRPQPEALLC